MLDGYLDLQTFLFIVLLFCIIAIALRYFIVLRPNNIKDKKTIEDNNNKFQSNITKMITDHNSLSIRNRNDHAEMENYMSAVEHAQRLATESQIMEFNNNQWLIPQLVQRTIELRANGSGGGAGGVGGAGGFGGGTLNTYEQFNEMEREMNPPFTTATSEPILNQEDINPTNKPNKSRNRFEDIIG